MWVSVLVLCCVGAVLSAPSPGISIRVSQKGLVYATSKLITMLGKQQLGQNIKNQTRNGGNFNYSLHNLVIQDVRLPRPHIRLQSGRGVRWQLSDAGVVLHGGWGYSFRWWFIHIPDSGTFNVSASGISITVNTTLGHSYGRPSVSVTGCRCDINSLSIKLHGGASWLYNIVIHLFKTLLKGFIQRMVCKQVNTVIKNEVRKKMKYMKFTVPFMNVLVMDYSLVAPPIITSSYIQLPLKGKIYHKAARLLDLPFKPQPLATPRVSRMVELSVSEYVLNSAGYALHEQGVFNYNLTRTDLSTKHRDMLNVTCQGFSLCVGNFIPQLQRFAGGHLELAMDSTTRPELHMSSSVISCQVRGLAVISIRMPDSQLHTVFSAEMNVTANLTAYIIRNRMTAKVTNLSPNLKVIKSEIGNITTTSINFILKAVSGFLVKNLNDLGAVSLDLPSLTFAKLGNTTLARLALRLEQKTLQLDTDLV